MPLSQGSDWQFCCVIVMYFEVGICEFCPDPIGIWKLKYNIEMLVILVVGFKILATFPNIFVQVDGHTGIEVAQFNCKLVLVGKVTSEEFDIFRLDLCVDIVDG